MPLFLHGMSPGPSARADTVCLGCCSVGPIQITYLCHLLILSLPASAAHCLSRPRLPSRCAALPSSPQAAGSSPSKTVVCSPMFLSTGLWPVVLPWGRGEGGRGRYPWAGGHSQDCRLMTDYRTTISHKIHFRAFGSSQPKLTALR